MPILDYTGANTGLFVHAGAIIARINSYQAVGNTTLPADLADLLAAFGTTWLPEEGVASYYDGLRDSVTGWRQGLASYADRRLLDFETVLRPMGLPVGSGLPEALIALRRAMRDDAQSVKACLCGVGAPAYASANRGNGKAWLTTTLDGFNAPVAGGLADWSYDGEATQLAVPSETMTLECVADSVMDGMPKGGEAWRWWGHPDHGPLDVRSEGSGEGPGLLTADRGENLLSNGSLDTWGDSGSAPSGWSRIGSVTRNSTVRLHGTGYAATFGGAGSLTQRIPAGSVQGRRRYWIGFSARAAAALPGVSVQLRLEGTDFAPGSVAQIDGSTFVADTWKQTGAFVTLPSPVPADLQAVASCTAGGVTIDGLTVAPAVYHGGLGAAVQSGSTVWQRGDRITWSVTNNQAGKFQDFWRRWYRCQLPCVAGTPAQGTFLTILLLQIFSQGVETIADTLVA
jgi:hypothetical protein